MTPQTFKRRKLGSPSFKSEDVGGASDNGSAQITDEGATDESYRSSSIRHTASGTAKARHGGAGQFASGAYNSNTFKLQMDELLVKVRPKYEKRMTKVGNTLRTLKGIIERIPSEKALPIPEAERKMKSRQIRIPFPDPRPSSEARYALAYAKPININVVGSYARKTTMQVEQRLTVDLAVTMPSQIFQEKDFLDHRYFHKRAYYLACIAAGIQEANLSLPREVYESPAIKHSPLGSCNFLIEFAYQDDNPLQPIINIDPVLDSGDDEFIKTKYQIRIILAAKEDLFPISKTLPDKTCIRARTPGLPTSFYNATLRSECSSLPYLELLHAASLQSDAFADSCLLGSIWLRQRGYSAALTFGGFGQFEWACIIAILMRSGGPKGKPLLSSGYSSYQLFKAVLQFLSTRDLVVDPLFVQSNGFAWKDSTKPVLFDGTRGHNILFKMTPWSYKMLRHEASITLRALSQTLSDGFLSSFITRIDNPFQRFDCVFNLSMSPDWTPMAKTKDCAGGIEQFCQDIYDALLIGLGDRVNLVHPARNKIPAWSTGLDTALTANRSETVVGLLINSEQVSRTIDKGPSAEDKQAAAAFRKFWGEKAELRRFKDGSILESLVWNSASAESSVLQQIIRYTVRRHFGQDIAKSIRFPGNSFNQLLPGPAMGDSHPTTVYQPLMGAFQTLEKELRSMDGWPLQIRQISAGSPSLRYASHHAPVLPPRDCNMEPADIYVQFEGSARWPDDISAVQRTKLAFLLKIGELLEDSTTGLTSRLGLENEEHRFFNVAFLDIIYPTGAIFRLRVHHERELSLLERLLRDNSYDQRRREEIAQAISAYKRDFAQTPSHTQVVRTLSTRFPLLSPSMRLMKQWCDSHLLSRHISDELIELLTILIFVHPDPWEAPGSLRTAFVRTLTSISKWDWRSEPLLVDFNRELSREEVEAINIRFEAWRKIDPGMNRIAMFVASSLDRDGVTWTEQGPSKVVAARFTSLARAACEVVKNRGLDVDAQALFVPSYADYDFLLHLDPTLMEKGRMQGKKQPAFKNLELLSVEDTSLVAFDPIQLFLDELYAICGSNIVFLHDAQKGSVIAGLWNPQTGARPWKVNVSYSTMPVVQPREEEPMITINKTAILNDIARLGGDLVSRVEVMR